MEWPSVISVVQIGRRCRGEFVASIETAARADEQTLQDLARRHLWLHFTRMSAYEDHEVPILVRGEGCYVYDEHGKRYLDGLAALFCVNIGHGRADIAQAGADQARELGFFTNWSYAHPRAIELAARIASLAPADLNRVFFTSGGSEAVESALKLARQYFKLAGKPNKTKLGDCKTGDAVCYLQAFGNLAYAKGPADALKVLQEKIGTDPSIEATCHPIAHTIGAGALLRYKGNVGKAFAAAGLRAEDVTVRRHPLFRLGLGRVKG